MNVVGVSAHGVGLNPVFASQISDETLDACLFTQEGQITIEALATEYHMHHSFL